MALETSKLFAQLPSEVRARLQGVAQPRTYQPGQEIFREGDPGEGLYVVREGLVEIAAFAGGQKPQVFSEVGPGDIFGEMAVIENEPRSATAIARKETTVDFVPREEMLQLLTTSPTLALALTREISRRLREFDRQYLREVVQAERLAVVGRFARSIIHDLKNPLNLIGLTAELAGAPDATPEERRNAAVSIRGQVERITEMVGEILEFTRGTSSDLVVSSMDYGEFLDRMVEELKPEAALKSVALNIANQWPEISLPLNPRRLRRVFYNLVHNAMDAMPGGGTITLRTRVEPTEIVTEFEDSGPGIAPEIADQLFQPFASYGKVYGTGLGLSICKRILEDHKGWIAYRKSQHGGAIFSFGLPRPAKT